MPRGRRSADRAGAGRAQTQLHTLDCLIMAKASPAAGGGGAVVPAAGAAAGIPLGREDSGTLINWCGWVDGLVVERLGFERAARTSICSPSSSEADPRRSSSSDLIQSFIRSKNRPDAPAAHPPLVRVPPSWFLSNHQPLAPVLLLGGWRRRSWVGGSSRLSVTVRWGSDR